MVVIAVVSVAPAVAVFAAAAVVPILVLLRVLPFLTSVAVTVLLLINVPDLDPVDLGTICWLCQSLLLLSDQRLYYASKALRLYCWSAFAVFAAGACCPRCCCCRPSTINIDVDIAPELKLLTDE